VRTDESRAYACSVCRRLATASQVYDLDGVFTCTDCYAAGQTASPVSPPTVARRAVPPAPGRSSTARVAVVTAGVLAIGSAYLMYCLRKANAELASLRAKAEPAHGVAVEPTRATAGPAIDQGPAPRRTLAEVVDADPVVSGFLSRFPDLEDDFKDLNHLRARQLSLKFVSLVAAGKMSLSESRYLAAFIKDNVSTPK
jgi:hypothetical protein